MNKTTQHINQILICGILLLYNSILSAQILPDFTNLTATGTVCNYGNTSNPFAYSGIAYNRHTVITQTGTDPNTGFQLPFLPAGESAVIRLGNSQVGSEAEAVTYRFTVNPQYSLLELKFAVVFEDPGHPHVAQPRFVVRVINALGQLVEQCSEYDVSAGSGVTGFNTFNGYGTPVRWRPWTNVGIDLSQYVGQEIRVQFVTYDCDYTGHYGYAYYAAHCITNQLDLTGCNGDIITLTAPSGFSSYSWSNGATTSNTTYPVSNGTVSAYCNITSVTGCQFTLNAYITSQPNLPTQDATYHETICQGESYQQHFFNIPPQIEWGNFVFMNSYYNLSNCEGNVTAILHLTVRQKYYNIIASVCAGTDYTNFGFNFADLPPGIIYDTLFLTGSSGCDSIICLQLTVNPTFQLPNVISGNTSPCQGTVETYSLQGASGLTNYLWNAPNGCIVMSGEGTPSISLFIGNNAIEGDLDLLGNNGCGSGSVPLTISPKTSYHQFYSDTICTGNDFHQYGFHIPVQDSVGYYTFTQHLQTGNACDSIITLALIVADTPTLTVTAQPEVICTGNITQLNTIGEGAYFNEITTSQIVFIGDILCTDSTIVKPATWPVPGKTAKGVVFYVDSTGEHGWAVHLNDQGTNIMWGGYGTDIPTLTNYSTTQTALLDLDGYSNTQIIRSTGNSITYPAAWAVDFANGWYLPAVGQLRKLYGVISWINPTLQIVSGTQFPTHLNGGSNIWWWYWSSTECFLYDVWAVGAYGYFGSGYTKNRKFRVRAIRSF